MTILISNKNTRKVVIIFFVCLASSTHPKFMSEDEEAKYLIQLKERELKLFEEEMKSQSLRRKGNAIDNGMAKNIDTLKQPLTSDVDNSLYSHQYDKNKRKTISVEDTTEENLNENNLWCYFCASPINNLKPAIRKSIRNLLEIRRTTYPLDAVTPECISARNLTKLKKQKCSFKYCQTLSILDRNAGNAFVVRGCAEYFGAVNVPLLEQKSDHSCQMLHESLEIKECICKKEKYCNAGWKKNSSYFFNRNVYVIISIVTVFIMG